ncbi:Sua5/YciO/YrdC/YwlC family protein [bacterium]|nr:Sua5/YciO/YrdC/YwlC family protein [bacterium]
MDEFEIKDSEIARAYKIIRTGGLAIVPSRVGYTLLGNSEHAIKKMFDVKGRPLTKPCVVLTKHSFLPEIAEIPPQYMAFVDSIEEQKLLCGFILKRKTHSIFDSLPEYVRLNSRRDDDTSCFVINAGLYIQYLVEEALKDGTVVVGSSANASGTGNEGIFANIPTNIQKAVEYFVEDDVYVRREYNHATREQGVMVALFGKRPEITRKGIMHSKIVELLQKETNY